MLGQAAVLDKLAKGLQQRPTADRPVARAGVLSLQFDPLPSDVEELLRGRDLVRRLLESVYRLFPAELDQMRKGER